MQKLFIPLVTLIYLSIYHVQAQNYVLKGEAIQIVPDLQFKLTNASDPRGNLSGGVWNTTQLDLNRNFTIKAQLNFGADDQFGADGIAFVLQKNIGSLTSSSGSGLGYVGVSPGLAVEFDTWENSDLNDPSSSRHDHIGFMKNGNNYHSGGAGTPSNMLFQQYAILQKDGVFTNVEDGNWHPVIIKWDASAHKLTVNLLGNDYILQQDLVASIFGGTSSVYLGFTAAFGVFKSTQQVKIESISNEEVYTFYRDIDGDGFGDPNNSITASSPPAGYVANNHDCDDSKKLYADVDGDGFGSTTLVACGGVEKTGDNCPNISNSNQKDLDKDGIGDVCDAITCVEGAINSLMSDIQAMNIAANLKKSLIDKLAVVSKSYAAGKLKGAVSQLNDFINLVKAKRGKELTNEDADDLISRALAVSNAIENGKTGCGGSAATMASQKISSLEEQLNGEKFTVKVMPNPSSDYFTLHFKTSNLQPIALRVIDALGRVIEAKSNINTTASFTLGQTYPQGVYHIELVQGKMRRTLKVIKIAN